MSPQSSKLFTARRKFWVNIIDYHIAQLGTVIVVTKSLMVERKEVQKSAQIMGSHHCNFQFSSNSRLTKEETLVIPNFREGCLETWSPR